MCNDRTSGSPVFLEKAFQGEIAACKGDMFFHNVPVVLFVVFWDRCLLNQLRTLENSKINSSRKCLAQFLNVRQLLFRWDTNNSSVLLYLLPFITSC